MATSTSQQKVGKIPLYVLLLIGGMLIGFLISSIIPREQSSIFENNILPQWRTSLPYGSNEINSLPSNTFYKKVEMKLPAVYEANHTGAYVLAKMYLTKGEGNIFVHINPVLYDESTEQSIRKAIRFALNRTHTPEDEYDFYVSLDSEASVLSGPSAGAAFTIMAMALLQNKSINQSVMITGTISQTGRIGLSGKIADKAKVAKELGAELFLVPKGLSYEYGIEQQEECDVWGGKKYCDVVEYINLTKIEDLARIKVIEVETVDEAAHYMLY
ncbi:MAG: hypothetical protein GXN99_00645 [Candidatus Nanohaloarchaeota archaeon]|nr:hypothetical protein [Candidatus Nanohaloarchaeota archaeon]